MRSHIPKIGYFAFWTEASKQKVAELWLNLSIHTAHRKNQVCGVPERQIGAIGDSSAIDRCQMCLKRLLSGEGYSDCGGLWLISQIFRLKNLSWLPMIVGLHRRYKQCRNPDHPLPDL